MTSRVGRARPTSLTTGAILLLALALSLPATASSTLVPGHDHDRYDQDGNGYPDEGVTTVGAYDSLYAYDATGDWYWDLGDGRVGGRSTPSTSWTKPR